MAQGQFSENHFGNANLSNEGLDEKCLTLDLLHFAVSLGLPAERIISGVGPRAGAER